ncbi:DNA-binding protein [Archaeoglobales archaeon]|nr:MAG: DNA-binding protein [Archaeoglobales archaeon]
MPVLDTNVLIDKIRRSEKINENITEITVLEYPPILKYSKFYGRIYYLKRTDLNLALKIQTNLRKIGAQKPIPDLLIASICINRDEELITKDEDFLDIAKVSNLKVRIIR